MYNTHAVTIYYKAKNYYTMYILYIIYLYLIMMATL